jgi:predicted PurR-regulated permease PerM
MSVKREHQLWIWLLVFALILAFCILLRSILLPFIAGMAVAYFLDPLADKLERWGLSRTVSTVVLTVAFFVIVVTTLILIFPLLQAQILGFFARLPMTIKSFEEWIAPLKDMLSDQFRSDKIDELSDVSNSYGGAIVKWFGSLLKSLLRGGYAVFSALSLLLVTPVVSFYLLRDWDKIVAKVDNWLPRQYANSIRIILKDIDTTIAGFVRGQGTVCLFLAIFYGVGLTIVGLDFGLIIGVTSGLISFIPYFGMLIGLIAALGMAISQYGEIVQVILVLAVFIGGQIIESTFLTPKLVGEKVGLHAVWIIFALMVGGVIGGFTGVLLAVPVAATIGVLVRFFLAQYLDSPFYQGPSDRDQSS